MPHRILEYLGGFPFLLAVTDGGKRVRVNWARIVEAIIIAAVAGLLAGYITVQKIAVQVEIMKEDQRKIDQRLWDHIRENQCGKTSPK